ncbi:hypothetical protein HNR44_000097 [Geomicrobium halophilum]|uniref:Amidohydrolase 3 domain-containing protein n=1 Tax=Geomicrobium halophilum TaxID=549000 RepID=A0A841PZK7_9BACL|nr:amidohydrolase [Geomicrobium halophilum]MBB6448148.1 hypothetical protein [Geomicrobium halophilum]
MGILWYNGVVCTMEHKHERAEAVFTEEGFIVAVGHVQELEKDYGHRISSRKNLNKGVMFPGFIDSHAHMLGFGQNLLRLDISEARTPLSLLRQLEDKEKTLDDEWLIGEGWNENNFQDQHIIHKRELDDRFPDRPVMLTRICRHAIIVNSKALKMAGIDDTTPNPEGGVIVKDEEGKTTGLLLENAQDLIYDVSPALTENAMKRALSVAFNHMVERGLTGVHTEDLAYYGNFERVLHAYKETIDGKKRKFRIHHLVNHHVLDAFMDSSQKAMEFQTFGAVKIFADGSLGGHSAWLIEPYLDNPETKGVAIHSEEGLKALVKHARAQGLPVAVHVIGDAALMQTLDVIEAYPPPEGKKDRLIHVQIANHELIERMQKLPVVLDVQPQFTVSDFPWVEHLVGKERLTYSYAWKTLLEKGIDCAGGSDAPIEPPDPLLGLHAAITRRKPGETHAGFLPDQKLTAFEAVQLYTEGSAKASGEESQYGRIQPGYRADFTVLNKDPLTMEDPDELLRTRILMTIIDESIMYEG